MEMLELNNNRSSPKRIITRSRSVIPRVGTPIKEGLLHMVQTVEGSTRVQPVMVKVYLSGLRHFAVVSYHTTGQIVRDLGCINLKSCSVDCVEVPQGLANRGQTVGLKLRPLAYDGPPLVFTLKDEAERELWMSALTHEEVLATSRSPSGRDRTCLRCLSWPATTSYSSEKHDTMTEDAGSAFLSEDKCPTGDTTSNESKQNDNCSHKYSPLRISVDPDILSEAKTGFRLTPPPPRSPSSPFTRTEAGLFSNVSGMRSGTPSPVQHRPSLPSVTEDAVQITDQDDYMDVFD